MKNPTTFLALMFITSILMLVSFATANIYLLMFSEVFFIISGSTFYIINKQLNKSPKREF
jgi:predicted secreted Zn-dependent protease